MNFQDFFDSNYQEIIGWSFMAMLFILLAFYFKGQNKKKGELCSICELSTDDIYSFLDKSGGDNLFKDIYLCREHLVLRWKKDFLKLSGNYIVIEPDFKKYPYGYFCDELEVIGDYYPKGSVKNVTEILESIVGKGCESCQSKASVAFYKVENYKPQHLENLKEVGGYFCKECVVPKVWIKLEQYTGSFTEGLRQGREGKSGVYTVEIF